jgi:hypothetical protein
MNSGNFITEILMGVSRRKLNFLEQLAVAQEDIDVNLLDVT